MPADPNTPAAGVVSCPCGAMDERVCAEAVTRHPNCTVPDDDSDDDTCTSCWGTGWNGNMEQRCDCQGALPEPAAPPAVGAEVVVPRGIYVASRASVPERGAMWRRFREIGYPIVSSWIDEDGPGQTASMAALWERIVREVSSAFALVLFVGEDDLPLKGAYVEVGIALGAGVPVHVMCCCLTDTISLRPLGSWAAHPLVTLHCSLQQAMDAALAAPSAPRAEGDVEARDCSVCGGDCSAANPPMMHCPVRDALPHPAPEVAPAAAARMQTGTVTAESEIARLGSKVTTYAGVPTLTTPPDDTARLRDVVSRLADRFHGATLTDLYEGQGVTMMELVRDARAALTPGSAA